MAHVYANLNETDAIAGLNSTNGSMNWQMFKDTRSIFSPLQSIEVTNGVLQTHNPQPNLSISQSVVSPHTPTTSSMSNSEQNAVPNLASILGISSRYKAQHFSIGEFKILLEEIEKYNHVIFSISPTSVRMKRRAWDDVSSRMAIRCPNGPFRTADQLKRKWENVLARTKRKIRNGEINSPCSWTEANSLIMEFLVRQHARLQMRHGKSRQKFELDIVSEQVSSELPDASQPSIVLSPEAYSSEVISSLRIEPSSVSTHCCLPELSNTAIKVESCSKYAPTSQRISCSPPFNNVISVDDDDGNGKGAILLLDDSDQDAGDSLETNGQYNSNHMQPVQCSTLNSTEPQVDLTEDETDKSRSESSEQTVEHGAFGYGCILDSTNTLLSRGSPIGHNAPPRPPLKDHALQQVWLDHETREHELRMHVLNLQKQAWELRIRLLNKQLDKSTTFQERNGSV